MPTDGFKQHCREIARRFLLTAVVVDDELTITGDRAVHGHLTAPRRGARTRRAPAAAEAQTRRPQPLDVDSITWSFARQGMVCGVLSPIEGQVAHEFLAKAMARADIVILDWWLNRTRDVNALPLLERVLTEDQPHRLRLLAFYTGDSRHEKIREEIVECLNGLDGPGEAVRISDGSGDAIDFRACRIVVYGKPDSGAEPSAVVDEEALADQLIADFADMVEGLLPSVVLSALGAVRENVHRLLECFAQDLDPAFLVHRACLPQPPDSEQHIVEQIASELHGVMEDAVGEWSPAGIGAIELWLEDRFQDRGIVLAPRTEGAQGKSMSHEEVLAMLKRGIEAEPGPLRKSGKDYHLLSHGFSGGAHNSRELDRHLTAVMSLRQVPPATWRQLSMGTVVVRAGADEAATLLCVTPRCDSVRLTGTTQFLFLRLTEAKPNTLQIVVPVEDNQHRRMTVLLNPSQWCSVGFVPNPDRRCVLAHRDGTDRFFRFKDVDRGAYRWVGELKPEYAQSIAQAIAVRMSRIPLNPSEWIRRSQSVGIREN